MRCTRNVSCLAVAAAAAAVSLALGPPRPTAAPRPVAGISGPSCHTSVEVGGKYVPSDKPCVPQKYEGGKWIDVTYYRPIKRGRNDLFGSGPDYGKKLNASAPVWRAGANVTTRLKTEVPLEIG